MKIVQVITRSVAGGAQTVVAHLSNELIKMGHEVVVVSGEGDGSLWNWLDPKIKQIECPSLVRELSFKKDIKAYKELKEIARQEKPDIFHLHSSKSGTLGRIAFPRKKTLYTVHGFDGVGFPLYKQVEWLMQFRCNALVGVCQNDVNDMRSAHVTRNVSYIFNGIPEPSAEKPKGWAVPSKYKKTILCIARLAAPKNHVLFYETAKLLPEYAFVWIGNQQEVENHPDNVFFLGNFPFASRYCQLCDIFMLPSDFEGLPMTIIEAMSYGKPVVASRVGGVAEIVRDGINGYALKNNPQLFAEKIEMILSDDALYEKMSAAALSIYNKELSAKHMAEEYVKVYEKLTKK